MGTQLLEVSPLGVGTVPRLEKDAWSTVNDSGKQKKKISTPPAPPPPTSLIYQPFACRQKSHGYSIPRKINAHH